MKNILEVKRLTVYRGKHAAIQDVSFDLKAGLNTALIGPNGAGKSTLVQAILGILPRRTGEVCLLGHPLKRSGHLPAALHQDIAYLPQNFLFDRRIPMTVAELVGLGWHKRGLSLPWSNRRECNLAVKFALSRVNASYLIRKPISSLSGGETKRVLLAYCLVRPRRLLILDEAPTGLDFHSELEFYRLLKELQREQGWTILQISHDLDFVRDHCDRVLCLNRHLIDNGVPELVLSPENLMSIYRPTITNSYPPSFI